MISHREHRHHQRRPVALLKPACTRAHRTIPRSSAPHCKTTLQEQLQRPSESPASIMAGAAPSGDDRAAEPREAAACPGTQAEAVGDVRALAYPLASCARPSPRVQPFQRCRYSRLKGRPSSAVPAGGPPAPAADDRAGSRCDHRHVLMLAVVAWRNLPVGAGQGGPERTLGRTLFVAVARWRRAGNGAKKCRSGSRCRRAIRPTCRN